ncbi:MAG: 16S rRNA (cytosine(1402)-N(4))-methyltransferase RsmH [Chloroflexi bacterium]|nr:16S rRNA (cytosine(1402)-N(4))-methyltransferase RsmH [Chloroflexota bacterium]
MYQHTPLPPYHSPALMKEALAFLDLHPGDRCVDGTLGDGGHSMAILEATSPNGRLLALDADGAALERARQRLQPFTDRVVLVNDNFANLATVVRTHGFAPVPGVLLDLGLSSWQLSEARRGFSFSDEAPLDMRLSASQPFTAAEVVNTYSQEELSHILFTYGEEPQARRIAQAILRRRPIATALELAQAVEGVVPRRGRRISPATRTFLALRMWVNSDLENLQAALQGAIGVLKRGGRLVVIAYHSLEDAKVKRFMRQEARDCICPPEQVPCVCGHKATVKVLTRKVVMPSAEEVARNPRVRSARLRACAAL